MMNHDPVATAPGSDTYAAPNLSWITADGFGLDDHVVVSGIVAEISFVDAQKQHAVALYHKVAAATGFA